MTLRIDRETRLCLSISARPSNFGTRFHNYLYEELGLNYVYKAFAITDLAGAVAGIRAFGIRGAGVSMPFKEAVIAFADELRPSAAAIGAVNTLVNDGGRLTAHNTDYIAVARLVVDHGVPPATPVVLRGSGGMAKAVAAALCDAGFRSGTVVARNEDAGRALAARCGWEWSPTLAPKPGEAMLVNVTPIGMAGGPDADELAFPAEAIGTATVVFDVVALPSETPMIRVARSLGRPVITGAEVIALQAVEQFELYTGRRPAADQIARAAAFARA
ncbi:shikimate 5-dehydrogenase [Siculibacillus lacustris]|uniref:Shikimate 5-dehydrogenase n=1 Tax=Siculibacillus lacustris TaxID=1549641 RepID=A0A4V2KTP8_9HYPH|nr:shikimate 5-dehydrogenase [Siculibacillus lacustris]TBW38005.1 shikimate 5-dehydrogenase [Siculibacillus lacustris]